MSDSPRYPPGAGPNSGALPADPAYGVSLCLASLSILPVLPTKLIPFSDPSRPTSTPPVATSPVCASAPWP